MTLGIDLASLLTKVLTSTKSELFNSVLDKVEPYNSHREQLSFPFDKVLTLVQNNLFHSSLGKVGPHISLREWLNFLLD